MHSEMVTDLMMSRRSWLGAAAAGGLAAGCASVAETPKAAAGVPLDYSDPRDNLYAFGKIWAGFDDPVIGGFHGLMYARFGDQRMIPLFGYVGTGVLHAKMDERGDLWVKSRETGFFTDLATGDVLESWFNPFTEKTVSVYHFYNDVLVGRIGTEMPRFFTNTASPTLMNEGTAVADKDGRYPFILPFQQYGDDLMLSWDYTHEYANPVTPEGWPRSSTGERVSPSEHFTFSLSKQALEDRDLPSVRFTAGFSRISQFWPFMEMGGTPFADGALFGRMFSHKGLAGVEDVPPKVLAYLEKHAPEFLTLPATWDPTTKRIDTWSAYARDIAPENPDYEWQPDPFGPPTGKGAKGGSGQPSGAL